MREAIIEAVVKRVLVGDGAMGTELMKRGVEPGGCGDLLNVDEADKVSDVLLSYRKAGADCLTTNTFSANRWKLDAFGLGDRVAEINTAAVKLAREAADGAFVLADIGPTGRFVAPLGTDPREAFVDVYAQQAALVAEAGADAIILETFVSLEEILTALEGAVKTGLPVIASISYNRDQSGTFHTVMGDAVASSTKALEEAGAAVIAANCGLGPDVYVDLAGELVAAASVPVMVQPNAGMPQLARGETVFPMGPEEFASHAEAILEAGVRIIGGCCGTTPEHIAALRRLVDAAL